MIKYGVPVLDLAKIKELNPGKIVEDDNDLDLKYRDKKNPKNNQTRVEINESKK